MPTPIEILLDPISIGVIVLYLSLMLIEVIAPARQQVYVKAWVPKALFSFVVYFYLASYLPLIWDAYLAEYQLLDLSNMHVALATVISVLVFELLLYVWHRTIHETGFLWRAFHQMHHSAERVDTFGAFYFSPLDMVGFTLLGSVSIVLVVGVSPEVATYYLFVTMFLAIFQHTNINTPQWLGYLIQRPESHAVHHGKGIHRYNYSDLPVFDIIFGTFKNPNTYEVETGFYHGASARVADMLLWRDVSRERDEHTRNLKRS